MFYRLTKGSANNSALESQRALASQPVKCTDVTGIKRSNALYEDFKDRQARHTIVERVTQEKEKKKGTKAVDMNAKSRRLAY